MSNIIYLDKHRPPPPPLRIAAVGWADEPTVFSELAALWATPYPADIMPFAEAVIARENAQLDELIAVWTKDR